MGTSFTELRSFFHKVFLNFKSLFNLYRVEIIFPQSLPQYQITLQPLQSWDHFSTKSSSISKHSSIFTELRSFFHKVFLNIKSLFNLYRVEIIFPQSLPQYQNTPTPLQSWDHFSTKSSSISKHSYTFTPDAASRQLQTLCWSVEALQPTRHRPQNGTIRLHFSGCQRSESATPETVGKMTENSPVASLVRRMMCSPGLSCRRTWFTPLLPPLQFSRNLRIRCFTFPNAWTYRSELMVIPQAKV